MGGSDLNEKVGQFCLTINNSQFLSDDMADTAGSVIEAI